MKSKNLARIGYFLFSIVLVAWFSSSIRNKDNPKQLAFEHWLSDTLPKMHNPKLDSRPVPQVTLSAVAPEQQINWTLTFNPEKNTQEVTRLLEMLRESRLLAGHPVGNPALTMTVVTNTESFSAAIEPKELESNSKAQSLLKLFQIYARANP